MVSQLQRLCWRLFWCLHLFHIEMTLVLYLTQWWAWWHVYDLNCGKSIWPVYHFLNSHSHLWIKMKNSWQELSCDFRQAHSQLIKWFTDDFLVKFLFWNCSPRNRAFEHLIKNDSNGPCITTNCINIVFESLWRHVNWWTHIIVFMHIELVSGNCKTKITNLVHILLIENICWFYVSVEIACVVNVQISTDYLLYYFDGLRIGDVLPLLQLIW